MTERLRVGILSTAKINDAILAGARDSAGAEVVAVASRDRGRAEAYAAEKGIPRAHGSYEDLLADEDGRGGLHPAAELAARAVVRAGAGGRQARAVREAAVARGRPTSRRRSTPPSAPGGS